MFSPTLDAEACCARAGFGRFQVVLLLYCGCAWAADAMEMMLLSFLGPAVRCEWGLTPSQEGLITSVVFLARPCLLRCPCPACAITVCWSTAVSDNAMRSRICVCNF